MRVFVAGWFYVTEFSKNEFGFYKNFYCSWTIKKYDRGKKYYLVAYDEENNVEAFRHEVIMDAAFENG